MTSQDQSPRFALACAVVLVAAWCFYQPMKDRLDGLDPSERTACLIAERATGATARAWDVGGKQGVVDAFLDYPDGRKAAFEVTWAGLADGVLQRDKLLADDHHAWPLPGRWWWSIEVRDVRQLQRLRRCYANVIAMCETFDVREPQALPGAFRAGNEDVRWLLVYTGWQDGFVDEDLRGLRQVLTDAFQKPSLTRTSFSDSWAH